MSREGVAESWLLLGIDLAFVFLTIYGTEMKIQCVR